MKLMKPILTAGAAVAMLCACGGKKTISYEDFQKKLNDLPNTNVFYEEVKVTGTMTGEANPIDAKYKWDNSKKTYNPDSSSTSPAAIIQRVLNYILSWNGKTFLSFLSSLPPNLNKTCTENSIEFDNNGAKQIYTFSDDFAISSYKLTANSQSVEDLQFANSGAKYNI